MLPQDYIFTSESVSPGHPDKIADQISDLILDYALKKEPEGRCAIEVLAAKNNIIVAGETRLAFGQIRMDEIDHMIREHLKKIGSINHGFNADTVKITNLLNTQSQEIAMGVDASDTKKEGAGDQGIMFGYANNESDVLMPAALYYSHEILKELWARSENGFYKGLGPDAKSQVTINYKNGKPHSFNSVNVSVQHKQGITHSQISEIITDIITSIAPKDFITPETRIIVNPTGQFSIGGPTSDAGLTGRKIVVDTYGGYSPHGGGAFSGKDPTKVDRSATYMARYIAKNIAAAGLCEKAMLQISYIIGMSDPMSIFFTGLGTSKVDEREIVEAIKDNFDLTPEGIRKHLKLNRSIYLPTATFGHFGRHYNPEDDLFTWEKLDKVDIFQKLL